jgi:cytochrome c peroxidase
MDRAIIGWRPVSRILAALAFVAAWQGVFAAAQDRHDPVAIGAKLFADRRLSADGSISCASCHIPEKAFSDGRTVATGLNAQKGVRNTPSLTTAAFHQFFSWDGRRQSLEAQVLDPLLNPREHGLHSREDLVASLRSAD